MPFFIIVIIIIIGIIMIYNNLQNVKNNVKEAWSQIDVQLQRRFDLIPNLVETINEYMLHEKDVLTKITELRTLWAKSSTVKEKNDLNGKLSESLKTIMMLSENYPDLKASQNFLNLQNELKNTEDKIAVSRENYNEMITKYNTKLESIPFNIVAKLFGFNAEEWFKVDNVEIRNNIKVKFSK